MLNFCTLFDINYLPRALTLYSSLKKHINEFHLFIFAFDNKTEIILKKLNLDNITVISLEDFEDKTLKKIKTTRTPIEYYWTCTPSTILYVLNNYKVESCTYLDADLFFFSSPEVLINELGKDDSVIITSHRYTDIYSDLQYTSGIYCVQFITVKNDRNGLKALTWWRNSCYEWCYNRFENGKYGDQKYLDDWPERFKGIHVLNNLGGGVAPWNVQQYEIKNINDKLFGLEKSTQKSFEIVFFHFHGVLYFSDGKIKISEYEISVEVHKLIYLPYLYFLTNIDKQLKIIVHSAINNNLDKGIKLLSDYIKNDKYLYESYNLIADLLEKPGQKEFKKEINSDSIDENLNTIKKPDIALYFSNNSNYRNLYEQKYKSNVASFKIQKTTTFPKISVVTPSLNDDKHLEESIESVLSQNYPNLEFIIMDGGSTDNSVKIIKKYEKYLSYWKSSKDKGHYNAVIEGLKRTSGEIITWINSDDKFNTHAFEIVSAIFLNTSYISWLTGIPGKFNEEENFLPLQEIEIFSYFNGLHFLYSSPFIQQEGTFWRRTLWEKTVSSLNSDLALQGNLELCKNFLKQTDLYILDISLAIFRKLGKNSNQSLASYYQKYIQNAESIPEPENIIYGSKRTKILSDVSEPDYYLAKGYIIINKIHEKPEFLFELAKYLYNNGNFLKSFKLLDKALKFSPEDHIIFINYLNLAYSLGFKKLIKDFYNYFLEKKNNKIVHKIENKFFDEIEDFLEKREGMNEDKYLVSAIVATHNSEKIIPCLEDLENQTISNKLEIIIIDRNSSQTAGEIVKEFQRKYSNIKYIKAEEDETVFKTWNRAIKLSSGKYITNASTDNRHQNNAFEIMVSEFEKNPDIALVYTNFNVHKNDNVDLNKQIRLNFPEFSHWDRNILLYDRNIIGTQPMWRKEIHEEYGFFKEDPLISGDYEFWLRISQTHDFISLEEKLGIYLYSEESVQRINNEKWIPENQGFLNAYKEAYLSGRLINFKKELPVTFEEPAEDLKNSIYLKPVIGIDYFIEYKWNPNREINETGYYILLQKWEGWSLPENWIIPLIRDVDQLWVPGRFVKESYINAGINKEKIEIIPPGINTDKFRPGVSPLQLHTATSFKFLYSGSIIDRKGINLLLEAFTEEFGEPDDVCLVIRDNLVDVTPENFAIREKIRLLKQKPEIIFYSEELEKEQVPGLYTAADCLVYPYKSEGYPIQVLEAMSSGLPVIVTNGGASLDYCNNDNSYLIDALWQEKPENKLEILQLSGNIHCFEPDKNHLKKLMRHVFTDRNEAKNKGIAGRETVINKLSRERISEKISGAFAKLKTKPINRFNPKLFSQEIGAYKLSKGDYKAAVEEFVKAMKAGAENKDLFTSMAFCFEKLGDLKTAEIFNKKAEKL